MLGPKELSAWPPKIFHRSILAGIDYPYVKISEGTILLRIEIVFVVLIRYKMLWQKKEKKSITPFQVYHPILSNLERDEVALEPKIPIPSIA
jgi:hypothetical protein